MAVYNNPAIGQAAGNIAALFAPPSAADLAGYAQAANLRQKTDATSKLLKMAGGENFDQTAFDRLGVANGVWQPNQSYYSVDQTNSTLRSNNIRDNERAAEGDRLRTIADFYGPVAQDAVRPAIPAEVSAKVGLTGPLPAVQGNRSPLSETQWQAGELQRLLDQGTITDQNIASKFNSGTNVEQVVDPTTRQPKIVSRDAAIGMEPYINKGAEAKGELYNYVTADGKEGTAFFDGQTLVDEATRTRIPEGAKIYKASAQGTTDQIGMGTNSNRTDANRIRASVSNADLLVNQLESIVRENPAATGLAGDVVSFVQDAGQVVREFGQTLGKNPESPVTPEEFQAITDQLDKVTGGKYNPAYRQARALILELAYANASMNNPSGEVSMQALAREVDALGQGLMGNDQGLLGVLEITRDRMKRKLIQADVLDGTRPPLKPDDIGAGASTQQVPTPQSQAEFDALPLGAVYRDPDDGKLYRKQ